VPGVTMHHKGYVNGTAALDHLAGEKLVEWVTKLIERKSVDDVRCQECRVG
jgi:hypothetical protein